MDPFAFPSDDDISQYDISDEGEQSILCNGMQSLGIERNYVPDWRPPHAIREYHQNWYITSHLQRLSNSSNILSKQEGWHQRNLTTRK